MVSMAFIRLRGRWLLHSMGTGKYVRVMHDGRVVRRDLCNIASITPYGEVICQISRRKAEMDRSQGNSTGSTVGL